MSRLLQLKLPRQTLFCLGLILLGSLLTAGPAPKAVAASADCVPNESCPCDPVEGCKTRVKTSTCCIPPPCEIYQELVRARAWRNANQPSKHAMAVAMAGDEDSSYASYQVYKDKRKEELRKEHEKYTDCPYRYSLPPDLAARDIGDSCAIGAALPAPGTSFQPISKDQAKQDSEACAELVDAEYAEAEQDAYFCDQLTKASMDDLGTWLKQEQRRTTAKITSLEGALLQYVALCSFTLDSKLAQQVADKGIDALIDKALPKPPPKKSKPTKSKKKKTKPAKRG